MNSPRMMRIERIVTDKAINKKICVNLYDPCDLCYIPFQAGQSREKALAAVVGGVG